MRPAGTPRSPMLSSRLPPWRRRLVVALLLAGFATEVGRALYLQGFDSEFLGDKGRERYERVIDISATRGRILDRHGNVLAMSTPVKSLWAIPEDVRLTPSQLRELSTLIDADARELSRKLAGDRDFVFLKRQIPPETAARVANMKVAGIHQQDEYRRYYPAGEIMAHMLGFTGVEDAGQEGVELAFQASLAGHNGSRRVIKDRRGNVVEDVDSVRPPQDGKDVVLALDGKLQYLAYAALERAMRDTSAKAASAVVVDPRTGEVLAMVNLPTYNPNNRKRLSGPQLRNRAITDAFEPGSTMKPFIAALALDKGTARFNTLIDTAPGRLTIGRATISDAHVHGMLTLAQVIQKSSNIGIAKVALNLPPGDMDHMFRALGFGAPVDIGFPGATSGRLRPVKSWKPIEQATMSYGHGLSVSLMHMARAYQAFARDGDMLPLTLTRLDAPPPKGVEIFSAQATREVRAMLEMAVQPGGTAPAAQVPGYRVAGKTGTAHKLEDGVYVSKYLSSFVGFAPVSEPRLVIAVAIDEPQGKHFGGDVAAPVFSEIMNGSLRALGVAPDAPLKPLVMARAPDAGSGL